MYNRKELIEELYSIIEKNKEIEINDIKSKIGKYTTTQILELAEDIEEQKRVKIYVDESKERFSLEKKEGYQSVSDLNRIVKIGLISNPRLISNYSSISALYAAYKIFEIEDVRWVFVVGNLFNDTKGYKRSPSKVEEYIGEMEDLKKRVDYVAKIYPKIPGKKTHVVLGNRDIAYDKNSKEMVDQVSLLASKRKDDIRVVKKLVADVYNTNIKIHLYPIEGEDNLPKYYTSNAQNKVENMEFDENYFNIVVFGGYHIHFEFPRWGSNKSNYANYVISLPSLMFQTPYMEKHTKVNPKIGCVVLELELSKRGENGKRKLEKLRTKFYDLSKYAKKKDFYDTEVIKEETQKKLVNYLFENDEATLGDLSRYLRIPKDKVESAINEINEKYDKVKIAKSYGEKYKVKLPFKEYFEYPKIDINLNKRFKWMAISDTHLGYLDKDYSTYLIDKILESARKEKVNTIFHCGDIIEGFPGAEVFEGQRYEMKMKTGEEALEMIKEFLTKFESLGIQFAFIGGNHDEKLRNKTGMDILKVAYEFKLAQGSKNIRYLGLNEGDVKIEVEHSISENTLDKYFTSSTINKSFDIKFRLVHPHTGSGESLGWPIRKFAKYSKKDQILLIGNFHKACFLITSGFVGYLVPTTKFRDEFFETKGLPSHEGFWVSAILLDDKGGIFSIENTYFDLSEYGKNFEENKKSEVTIKIKK